MQTLQVSASILSLVLAQRETGILEILLLYERLRKRLLLPGEMVMAMLWLPAVGCAS